MHRESDEEKAFETRMARSPMFDFMLLKRLLCGLAVAICAAGTCGSTSGQQQGGPRKPEGTLAPVIDAAVYRQTTVDRRLPPTESLPAGSAGRRDGEGAVAGLNAANLAANVRYFNRQTAQEPAQPETVAAPEQLPSGFVPWWQAQVVGHLRTRSETHPVDLDALIISALAYSWRVRAISEDVLIQETGVLEAQAAFDVQAFMESKFFRKSDPVGNVLETGGPSRLREEDWGYSAGLRKRTPLGGSWEVSQRIGAHDSNSRFFTPEQQGNAKLSLSFNQPLLNGFGKAYNTAMIVLADIDTSVAMDQTSAALQNQLIQIVDAYWTLHLHRAVLVQQRRHLRRAQEIMEELVQRREVDSLESQIARARAAVAARQSELIRTETNIRNTEARIRVLTNAPELLSNPYAELIPLDYPAVVPMAVNLPDAMVTALQNRPEIDAASQEIRAASLRLNMSRNELLPALDLVLETYVSGLDKDYDISQSFADQFSVGEPSYTAGLVFEVPLQRRAAKARLQRRQLQLRQLTQRFDDTVQTLMSDVEVAVREVTATYREMLAKYRAMKAAEMDVDYLTQRWKLLAGDDRSVSFLLEDLLDAQDRLALEEYGFSVAQTDYTISQTTLKRAMGTLLQQEQIQPVRACCDGLPQLRFQRTARLVTPDEVLPQQARDLGQRDAMKSYRR